MPGERVTLRCKVDSNPPPVYTWTRLSDDTAAGSNPTLSHSANLTFVAGDATAGVYECSASASGHPAVASRAAVRVKGPPSIVDTPAVQWAALGSSAVSASVVCDVSAVPNVELIEWSFRGKVLEPRAAPVGGEASAVTNKYALLEGRTSEGVRSTLVVRNAADEDMGEYVCTVANAFGTDTKLIHLKRKGELRYEIECKG